MVFYRLLRIYSGLGKEIKEIYIREFPDSGFRNISLKVISLDVP